MFFEGKIGKKGRGYNPPVVVTVGIFGFGKKLVFWNFQKIEKNII